MDLRLLSLFVAVAEELHFGRAAARVGMAQPPFSQQIRKLEDRVGARLLVRNSRSVALTQAGEHLLSGARLLLARRADLIAEVRRISDGEAGTLRLGLAGSSALGLIPRIVAKLRQSHPGLHIIIDGRELLDVGRGLTLAEIDLAIVRAPFRHIGVQTMPLLGEGFAAALPSDHPLAAKPRIDLRSLADEPWVLFPNSNAPGLHSTIIEMCRVAGFVPRVALEANSWPIVARLVGSGFGVTLVPQSASLAPTPGVRFIDVDDGIGRASLEIAWREGAPPIFDTYRATLQTAIASVEEASA